MDKEVGVFLEYLKSKKLKEKAYFGIFQYGGGPDESCIKANTEGALQFTHDLLEAYTLLEEKLEKGEANPINTLSLDYNTDWIDGNTFVQYVELTQPDAEEVVTNQQASATTLGDYLSTIWMLRPTLYTGLLYTNRLGNGSKRDY